MATPTGDIRINGKPYRIDLPSYRKRDMVDFSPRAATPTGSIVMSELGLYQPLLQDDWRHGFGWSRHEDASGYMKTTGYVETGMEGIAMLYTQPVLSDSINESREGYVEFDGDIYAWGTCGLDKFNGTVWSDEYSTLPVNFALATKDYLFYCPDGGRIRKMDTSGVHTDAGNDSNSNDYSWLIIHSGYIYAGKDGTNYVHRDSTTDLSDLEGTTADPNMITVGGGGLETLGAIEYAGKLYISRPDGLWVLGDDSICRRVIDNSNEVSSDNFRSMAVHSGYLVYAIRDQVYQWNGVRVTVVTPPKIDDSFPYVTYGQFDNFVTVGEYMYCTARTSDTTYTVALLRFDGVAWTRLVDINSAGTGNISGMNYAPTANRLWYHDYRTGGATYYVQMRDKSAYPYENFPTTGTHSLYTSKLDMGFKAVYKSSPSLWAETSNISAGHYYIKVFYNLDDAGWVAWGGTDGTTNVISSNGVTELDDPLGTGLSTVEYYNMQLRFDFITDDSTESPILEAYTLRFLMRPEVFFGWNINILAEQGYIYDNKEDGRTVKAMLDDLETARDSKAPIEYVDLFETSHQAYITAINETAMERFDDELGATPHIVHTINVSITQVG